MTVRNKVSNPKSSMKRYGTLDSCFRRSDGSAGLRHTGQDYVESVLNTGRTP